MKKIIFALTMVAALMIGCQKPELNDTNEITNEVTEEITKSFSAAVEDFGPQTRTAMDYNKSVVWSSGDQVAIFLGRPVADLFLLDDNYAGKTNGSFGWVGEDGSVDENAAPSEKFPCNIAYYPYSEGLTVSKETDDSNKTIYNVENIFLPEVQTFSYDSFGNGSFPMVAVTETMGDHNLKFKNVMGAIQFEFYGNQIIQSISLKGNDGELLAGEATVTATEDNLAPTIQMGPEALTEVTLDCSGIKLNLGYTTKFIFALPPVRFTKGFTVTLQYANGNEYTISTDEVNEIRRSTLCVMPPQTAHGEGGPAYYSSLYVVGSYNGWYHENNQFLFDFEGDSNYYSGIIDFGEDHAANEFKITGGAWGVDEFSMIDYYEPESYNIFLVPGGGNNINVYQAKRFYHLTLSRWDCSLTADYSFNQLGMVGSFSGWGEDVIMAFNPVTQKFYADMEFDMYDEFKLRCDSEWVYSFGMKGDYLAFCDGDNIQAPVGKYRVYVDLNNLYNMSITFDEEAYGTEENPGFIEPEPDAGWGLVGEFNSWGGSPDIMLTYNDPYYVINDISIEGQFKFRKDGSWDINLGAPGDVEPYEITPDTETELLSYGKNMILPAGTYDIVLDVANSKAWFTKK